MLFDSKIYIHLSKNNAYIQLVTMTAKYAADFLLIQIHLTYLIASHVTVLVFYDLLS